MSSKLVRRLLWGGVATVAAFVAGATTPREAGAHCADHAGSCGTDWTDYNTWCDYRMGNEACGDWTSYSHVSYSVCSGTCWNGGTTGCCDSPEACWNAPCKPGGCGGGECWYYEYLGSQNIEDCYHCPPY